MKALAGACILAALWTAGCGSESAIDRVPVEGTVTFNGSPVKNGQIRFYPIEGTPGPVAGSPIVEGKYSVVNKALSWVNLRFEMRAYVERTTRRVIFFALAVE